MLNKIDINKGASILLDISGTWLLLMLNAIYEESKGSS